jgi:predicted short-subunit dehydrogenase-like oxidoreductase (DUF2520 family)
VSAAGKSLRYVVIGCGRLGITWARHLVAAGGRPVGFASRRAASAQSAREAAGGGQVFEDPGAAVRDADLVMIATPDDRIAEAGHILARASTLAPGTVVLHCSGALAAAILDPVRAAGAHAGSLHPLQSFAAPVIDTNPFAGIFMAAEGDPPAVDLAADLSARLGARFIRLPAGTKTLYHAAAVTASNYLVALVDGAIEMLSMCGLDARQAFELLEPLVRGTLVNIDRLGVAEALTGPIARGDTATVGRHCRDLGNHTPDLLPLYRVLGDRTLALAARGGTLDAAAFAALRALLADRVPGRDSTS